MFTSFADLESRINDKYFERTISTDEFRAVLNAILVLTFPDIYDKPWVKNAIFRHSDLRKVNWEEIVRHAGKDCLLGFSFAEANLQFSNLTDLNLAGTMLPEPIKLHGTKVRDTSITFEQMVHFYKAGIRDFSGITLSGQINEEETLQDILLSDQAFNYLKEQDYLNLDLVHVANFSKDKLVFIRNLKKPESEATSTVRLLKDRQKKLRDFISRFPRIEVYVFPYTPLLKPYLMETDLAEIILANTRFSKEIIQSNFKGFTENLVTLESILQNMATDEITTSESEQLESFKHDLQANSYKLENNYPSFPINKEKITALIGQLTIGQVLRLTQLDDSSSAFKRVMHIYKGEEDFGYFDKNYWIPSGLSSHFLYDFIHFIYPALESGSKQLFIEQYTCSNTASSLVTKLKKSDESKRSETLTIHSLTKANQYLLALKKQLSTKTDLKQFILLESDRAISLQGTPAELQRVKEANELLHECRKQDRSDLFCFYFLEKILSEPEDALYQRLFNLSNDLDSTLLARQKRALSTLETQCHANLKDVFETRLTHRELTLWESLSKREKAAAGATLTSIGLGIIFDSISLKSGGTPAAGPGVLGRGVRMSNAQRARMLDGIKEGITSSARATGGTPGLSVTNKAPATIRTQLRGQFRKGVRSSEIAKGSKAIFKVKKSIKLPKLGGFFFSILTSHSLYSGWKHAKAYADIALGDNEKSVIFFRGFINPFVSVDPHPQSVQQFLDENKIVEIKTQRATNFLKKYPNVLVYVGCLGQVSHNKVDPDFCSVNLGNERSLPRKSTNYKKSRKTPVPKVDNLEVICAPKFRADKEVAGSGSIDTSRYECDQGFAIINSTRALAPRDSTKEYWNYFDIKHAGSGELIPPGVDSNFLDASENPITKIHYQNNMLILQGPGNYQQFTGNNQKFIKTENMNYFLGRKNLTDIVDCLRMPQIKRVETQGGSRSLKDEIYECRDGALSPYTDVKSDQPGVHQYYINLGEGNISIEISNDEASLNLHFQLTVSELLTRANLTKKLSGGVNRLTILVDNTRIVIETPEKTTVTLLDNQWRQLVVQSNHSFHIAEQTNLLSNEEKLKQCHAYQRQTENSLTCSITTVTEEGTDWLEEDTLFVDAQGKGWAFIKASEDDELNIIPYLAEGIYTFSVSSIIDTPSMAIPVNVKHIAYFREGNNLVLKANRDDTTATFSLNLKNYYESPDPWGLLQLINLEGDDFDCDRRTNCITGKDFERYRHLAIPQTMEIAAINEMFQYYTFATPNSTQEETIWHNQQPDKSGGNSLTLAEKNIRIGYIKLENCNPSQIIFQSIEFDAVFTIIDVDNNKRLIYVKNWDSNPVHRIEGFIFDTFTISGLSSKAEPEKLRSHLNNVLLQAKINEEIKKIAKNPLDLIDIAAFVANQLLTENYFTGQVDKKNIIYKGLGFQSEKELDIFLLIHSLDQPKNSQSKLLQYNESYWQTLLFWMAAKASLLLVSSHVRILFPMLEPGNSKESRFEALHSVEFVGPQSPVASLSTMVTRTVEGEFGFDSLQNYIELLIELSKLSFERKKKPDQQQTLRYRLQAFNFNSDAIPHQIYHNQIHLPSGDWIATAEANRKKAYIDLGDNKVETIKLEKVMNDLVIFFHIKDSGDIVLKFKNGMNLVYRPEKIISDNGDLFNLTTLDGTLENFYSAEKIINKAVTINWLKDTQNEFIAPKNLRTLNAFLYSEARLNGSPLPQCFGFNSEALLNEFIHAYGNDFPDETKRRGNYQALFKGENPRNIKALYLQLALATQTELTQDEIVRCYPFLPDSFIRNFISSFRFFRTFFHLENLIDRAVLDKPLINLEIQWAAEGISFQLLNSTELYLSDHAYQVNAQPITYKLTHIISGDTHIIYHNQIQDLSGKWITKQKEIESGYIDLGDTGIEQVVIMREANDVTFCFTNNNNSSRSLVFKNWNDPIHRPEKIVNNHGLEVDLTNKEDIDIIQRLINSGIIETWAKTKQEELIISSDAQGDLIAFLYANAEKDALLPRCLGLNPEALEKFTVVYYAKYPTEEQRQTNYQTLFTTEYFRKNNIQILLWELVQTVQRDLAINEIQQCFPFISNDLLNQFVSYFRTHYEFNNFEEKLKSFAQDNNLAWELQKAAHVLKIYDLSPPFTYRGFLTRACLNLETVTYTSISISRGDRYITFYLDDYENKSQTKLLLKWDEPEHRLYGLMDKKKGWEIQDLHKYNARELSLQWPQLMEDALLAAKKKANAKQTTQIASVTEERMQGDQSFPESLEANRVSMNEKIKEPQGLLEPAYHHHQISVHDLQEKNATVNVIKDDASPSWTDTFKNWSAWSAGLISTGVLTCAGYVTWRLRRRWVHQRNILPTVTEAVAIPLLSQLSPANAAYIENDNFNYPKESLNSLSGPSVNSENKAGENNFLSSVSSHWDGQGTLSLLDAAVRWQIGQKYNASIENISYDRCLQEQIDNFAPSVEEAIQKGWWAEENFKDEETNFFNAADDWERSEQDFYYEAPQESIPSREHVSKQKSKQKKLAQHL